MGQKMKFAPVYFTIAQARFNPILSLDSFVPQIQEKLRNAGFPDFQKATLTTLNIPPASIQPDQSLPQSPLSQTARYIFGDMDRTSIFLLDPNAFSLQTTHYDVFETLSSSFKTGLQAVEEAVSLSYTDRIGLRYLDAVFPKPEETLRDYLCPGLLGLTEKFKDHGLTYAFSENLASVQGINVRLRVIIQDGKIGFPPDLVPLTLRLDEGFAELQGRHAIMDTDGWSESREKFTLENVAEQLRRIHEEIDKAFRASVTEKALRVWG